MASRSWTATATRSGRCRSSDEDICGRDGTGSTGCGVRVQLGGYLWPNTEVLTDKVLKNKKPKFYSHGVWINITTYSGAGLWDGKGQADTWTYGGGGH